MSTSTVDSGWARVERVWPRALGDARLQLHHAMQIAVSVPISYVEARADDSHTASRWSTSLAALLTEPVPLPSGRPLRMGLRPADLTLFVLIEREGAEQNVTRTFRLLGSTVAAAYEWLGTAVTDAGLDASRLTPSKHYTIPDHSVAHGAPFTLGIEEELAELGRYWSNAAGLLDIVARDTAGAGPVRCWPHHFDIATLLALPRTQAGHSRTIGVGHSPGDEWYDEPYWYVGPYPYPETADLPPLDGGGFWHTRGWVGGVLPATAYVGDPDQRARVVTFMASAMRESKKLVSAIV
jgi:hypothetical protein